MENPLTRLLDNRSWVGPLFIAVAICCMPGCANRVYRPASLPMEYAASEAVDLDSLDLSGLASSSTLQNVISWGDILSIEIDAGLPDLEAHTSRVQVARDGTVKIPLVGNVSVVGLEPEQAEAAIVAASQSRDIYTNPFVSVRLASPRKNRVTIVGAVEKPGSYELSRGSSSLMAALVAAGGVDDTASGDVELRHTDSRLAMSQSLQSAGMNAEQFGTRLVSHETSLAPDAGVVRLNLLDAAKSGAVKQELQDGDVVNVVARELPPIHVLGLVNKPGSFDMLANRDLRLLDAIALAGGCSNLAADRVAIKRHVANEEEPIMIVASLRRAMDGQENVLLAPGDTVVVRQTPQTVAVETIKSFVRVAIGGSIGIF